MTTDKQLLSEKKNTDHYSKLMQRSTFTVLVELLIFFEYMCGMCCRTTSLNGFRQGRASTNIDNQINIVVPLLNTF